MTFKVVQGYRRSRSLISHMRFPINIPYSNVTLTCIVYVIYSERVIGQKSRIV